MQRLSIDIYHVFASVSLYVALLQITHLWFQAFLSVFVNIRGNNYRHVTQQLMMGVLTFAKGGSIHSGD